MLGYGQFWAWLPVRCTIHTSSSCLQTSCATRVLVCSNRVPHALWQEESWVYALSTSVLFAKQSLVVTIVPTTPLSLLSCSGNHLLAHKRRCCTKSNCCCCLSSSILLANPVCRSCLHVMVTPPDEVPGSAPLLSVACFSGTLVLSCLSCPSVNLVCMHNRCCFCKIVLCEGVQVVSVVAQARLDDSVSQQSQGIVVEVQFVPLVPGLQWS